MRVKNKIIKKSKLVNYVTIVIVISYSLIVSILSTTSTSALAETFVSIRIPNGYSYVYINETAPEFEMAYYIGNKGIYDLSECLIEVKLDVEFYKDSELTTSRFNFVSVKEYLPYICGSTFQEGLIKARIQNFNLSLIENFYDEVNLSKPLSFKMDLELRGYYFLKLIYFEINTKNITI